MLSSWLSRRNGGVFEAVVAQAKILADMGAVPVVIGVREEHTEDDLWRFGEAEVRIADPSGPAALAFAPGLKAEITDADLDLLHLHGIWQYPSSVAGDWAKGSGKPLVISPHGMLDPWITRRNAWKKRLARALWERRAWRAASAFHALTDDEAQDIARETGASRVATIPNPTPPPSALPSVSRAPMALYIGRIHEKKNLAALIAAWIEARPDLPAGAILTIAGWADDTGVEMLERAMSEHREKGIEFVGTAFGSQKAALFDIARFLVLPSLSEGLPMAVLEGWSAGVPAIMTEHCHLPEGFDAGAAIECGTDRASIRSALVSAFNRPDAEWQEMSEAALGLARSTFSAEAVSARWEALYSALLAA